MPTEVWGPLAWQHTGCPSRGVSISDLWSPRGLYQKHLRKNLQAAPLNLCKSSCIKLLPLLRKRSEILGRENECEMGFEASSPEIKISVKFLNVLQREKHGKRITLSSGKETLQNIVLSRHGS